MLDTASYIGKRIGKYRIIAELSSHALNSVFQAEYAKSISAIKIMSKPLTTIKERERFFQEVRLLSMLKYPHILPLLDVGIYDDLPYVVTEYMSNGSLRDYFDEQSSLLVPLQETMYILLQIGQALNYAHQRNIIHGNLKPENILFNEQGRALLTDFRIEAMFGKTGYEQSYKSNTYPYMAPEQFKGVPGKATDQYALGCIAYEAFTGKVPFAAADYKAMARKHAHEFPIVPTQHNLLLPGRSEEAILKALAKQSANRYKTVKDLLQALSASITFRANMSARTPATLSVQSTQPDLAAQLSKPLSPASGEVPGIERARLKSNRLQPITANLSTTSAYAIPSAKVEGGRGRQMKVHREQQKHAATPEAIEENHRRRITAIIPSTVNRPATTRRVPLYKRAWLIAIAACLIITSALFSAYLLASLHMQTLKGANQVAHFQPTTVSSQLPTPVATTVPTVQAFPTPSPTIVPPLTPVPSPMPVAFPTPQPMPSPTPIPTFTPAPSPTPVVMLTVTPTVLSLLQNCAATRLGFRCTIRLSLSQNYSGTLAWSASSKGVFTIFRPQHGQLLPGASVQVVLHIYNGCPGSGSFVFSTAIGNVSVAWNC